MLKTCTKCKEIKPVGCFLKRKNRAGGYRSQCNDCRSRSRRVRYQASEEFRQRNLLLQRYSRLEGREGISSDEYVELWKGQTECWVCEGELSKKQSVVPAVIDGVVVLTCKFCQRNPNGKGCSKCGETKARNAFSKNSKMSGGISSWCRACTGAYYRKWRQDPAKKTDAAYRQIKYKFGLSKDQYDSMLDKQEGSCAICKIDFGDDSKANVDHCHVTGNIRGLLCGLCNSMLGFAKDRISILQNAIGYLKEDR